MAVAALKRTEAVVDDSTIEQRVAILRKLKEHLLHQRTKFKEYLHLLELEEQDIHAGDTEKLKIHTEMGKNIVQELYAFQKVIDPMEDLYRMAYPVEEAELPEIRVSLELLKEEVQKRNRRNIASLSTAMKVMKSDILAIKNPYCYRNRYNLAAPTLIDITT